MVLVPRVDDIPSVLPQGIADQTLRVQAGPDAFGGQVGQAISGLQKPADLVAGQLNRVAANEAIDTYTNGARKILQGDPDTPGDTGFLGLRGKDAVLAAPAVSKQLNDLYNQTQGSLTTDDQLSQFDQMARRYQQRDLEQLGAFRDQQSEVYSNQQSEASLGLASQGFASSYNDPSGMQINLDRIRQVVQQQGGQQGWSPERLQLETQTAIGKAYGGAVEAAAGESPEKAQSLLQQVRGQMNPDTVARLSEWLQPKVNQAVADRITQSITGNPGGAPVGVPSGAAVDGIWHSMRSIESGGNQFAADGSTLTSPVGGADAPVGVSQIRPSTARDAAVSAGLPYDEQRLRTDPAYNERLGKEYLTTMMARYGDPTLAVAAYNAGPAMVDQWLKQNGDPRDGAISDAAWVGKIPAAETRNYVTRVGSENGAAVTAPTSGYQGPPPLDDQLAAATSRTAGLPPEVQDRVLSGVERNYHLQTIEMQGQRQALAKEVSGLSAAYMQGETTDAVPEDQIRRLYPAEQAEPMIAQLHIEQQAGIAFKGVQWASPEQEQALRQQIEDPNSLAAQRIQARGKTLSGPGVVTPASATGAPPQPQAAIDLSAAPVAEDEETTKLRTQVTQRLETLISQKHQAIVADPVAYAQGAPSVQAALAKIDQDKPETFQAYVDAEMSVQRSLGVQNPRILTNAQVQSVVQKLSSTDPAKADVGTILDATSKQYGGLWPQVFGELVDRGKLNPEYQTIAAMDAPAQTMARTDFQRALQIPLKDLQTAAGTAKPDIDGKSGSDQPIDDALSAFKATTINNTGGVQLYDTVRSSVQRLAYYYASQGQSGPQAVDRAVAGVIGDKYDFSGTMRVPKGMLDDVQNAVATRLAGLKPDDLAPMPGNPALTQEERQGIALTAARAGNWVPNADDSGLVLMSGIRNGGVLPVRGADGKPISITFDDVRAGKYPKLVQDFGTQDDRPPMMTAGQQ